MQVTIPLSHYLGLKMAIPAVSANAAGLKAMDALAETMDKAAEEPAKVAGLIIMGDAWVPSPTIDWTQRVTFDLTGQQLDILAEGFGSIKWRGELLQPKVREALIDLDTAITDWKAQADKQAMFDALTPEQRRSLAELTKAAPRPQEHECGPDGCVFKPSNTNGEPILLALNNDAPPQREIG